MSGVQSLLAIGALMFFGLVTLRFNSSVIQNISLEVENKVYLTAFSLADDKIEEIKEKAFDEETITFRAINTDELSNIGPDNGENNRKLFDDVDDFHNDTVHVGLPYVENFVVHTKVYYADPTNLNLILTTGKSYYKRVDVQVTSEHLSNPVNLSFIFTLHSK